MKVVIIHRNPVSGHGITLLLDKYGEFDVAAEVSDPDEAVSTTIVESPDLVLIDAEFTELDLDESIRKIKEALPESSVALLTGSDDWAHLESSIRAGATSFVSMNADPEEFVLCLRLVADGHVLVSTPLVSTLSELIAGKPVPEENAPVHDLSERELEILNHVAQGATNLEIAEALIISDNTVKVHMRNILSKLQLRNRQQAAAYALRSGLVTDTALTEPSISL